jgi:pimeloyl-ACP methyl ester carboxylesterase
VVLLGTAQTVKTFTHHCRDFSHHSRLVVPELRCQGTTNLLTNKCSVDQQVIDLEHILNELDIKKCNLIGFSFGGRVAIAFAANRAKYVNKVSLSGVPLIRPNLGKAILQSWEDDLKAGIIPAWSFILNGYSDSYLKKYASKLHTYVDYVKEQNNVEKLKDLISSTNLAGSDNESRFSVKSCSRALKCPTQIIAGKHDRISGLKDVMDLAQEIQKNENAIVEYEEINAGHILPFEDIVGWRNLVLQFLKKEHT